MILDEQYRTTRVEGFTQHCGIRIESGQDGTCTVSCDVQDCHLNPVGIVHGGLIYTMMDVAAGSAAISFCDHQRKITTRSGDIHYLLPLRAGRITATAHVVRGGSRMAYIQADVCNEAGELCASGVFEYFYLD